MLLVDIGNTRLKWALWQEGRPVSSQALVYDRQQIGRQLQQCLGNVERQQRVSICSVASVEVNNAVRDWFVENWQRKPVFASAKKQQIGVVNVYADPQQLGVDRWMAMIGAHAKFHNDTCVIDCGSAITVDVLDAGGKHRGGLIMPGVRMMRNSLLQDTAGISGVDGVVTVLADNTADAVYSGCLQMAVLGLSQLVREYRQRYGAGMDCVITGGDGEQISQAMDCGCCFDADLILYGLGLVSSDI